ncbi:MAG: hypothetical protein H6984_03965 [Pseudomonadales bacterium]|nr:hypothetical protein [Halioglobus sp.]MCP5121599.1 hypothetical protein [Pseudomonadales bacterium]MCP5194938.1 hypothetical protein [Pseudomonadales bacterium]
MFHRHIRSPGPALVGRSPDHKGIRVIGGGGYADGPVGGLYVVAFGCGSGSLPADFDAFPPKQGHELFAACIAVLVLIHFCAAMYHKFVLKDGLLGRMWFGKR